MVRTRLFTLWAAAVLGLACGCSSISNHPWFGRSACNRGSNGLECESATISEGPILDDGGSFMLSPGCGVPSGTTLAPQTVFPPLAPTPRIQAQPQAQPIPSRPD